MTFVNSNDGVPIKLTKDEQSPSLCQFTNWIDQPAISPVYYSLLLY
jgi:hypothetical protein